MAVKITVDLKGATRKLSEQNFTRGRIAMASQMLMDMDRLIPYKDGSLRASGHMASDGSELSWSTVYARAQFYGTNGIVTFQSYTTPGTGKRWDEKAKAQYGDNWRKVFVKGAGL